MSEKIGPPALSHTFTELARATVELWALRALYNPLKKYTKEGDGRPVLVIPGFGSSDLSTLELRHFLSEKGYKAEGWNAGTNTGPSEATLSAVKARLDQMFEESGGQKITLVGHSLGGIYARELARAFPKKISQVITLGSPFGAGLHPEATLPIIRKLFKFFNGNNHPFITDEALAKISIQPPPVPTSSIYSRGDGIVHWQTCVNPIHPMAENIEVSGSHCGLVVNPLALVAITDRLAQDVGVTPKKWQAFDPKNYLLFSVFPAGSHCGLEPCYERRAWQFTKPGIFS